MIKFIYAIAATGLCIPMNVAEAKEPAKDPDLVTHYTFDKDESKRVTDHSSYGHDAKNTNAQWLADVQERSGFMRFNGTDAKLTAQYPSLAMEGDATITMWIRGNAEEIRRCSIFSDPGGSQGLDLGFSDYIHFILYDHWTDPLCGNERMSFPMDHDMFPMK